jgi:hypothetical protein
MARYKVRNGILSDEDKLRLDSMFARKPARAVAGEPGTAGRKGKPGADGRDGDPGKPGRKGDKGDQGEPGIRGKIGRPGEKGKPGRDGKNGAKGDKGDRGAAGRTGKPGNPGKPGPKGEAGKRGPKGDDGLSFHQVKGVPPRSLGVDGESAVNSNNGDLYKKVKGSWGKTGSLRGKDGKHGIGMRGPRGFAGTGGGEPGSGGSGEPGADGWSPVFAVATDGARRVLQVVDWVGGEGTKPGLGYVGATGIEADIANAVDIRGATGLQGDPGDPGDPGAPGDDGDPGAPGVDGNDGWTPLLAVVSDGARRVIELIGWTGGEGDPPEFDSDSGPLYVGPLGFVSDIAEATDVRGEAGTNGTNGTNGTDGNDGWSPVLAVVTDGARRVLQVTDWVGGEGTKPATGGYIGATGLEALIANGVDIRGATGSTGNTGNTGAAGPSNLPDVGVGADKTFALTDSGTMNRHNSGVAHAWTIPPNSSVNFPIGTAITLVVPQAQGVITVTRGSGVALYLGGAANTNANRTLSPVGLATIVQVITDVWVISGVGLT